MDYDAARSQFESRMDKQDKIEQTSKVFYYVKDSLPKGV